MDLITLGTLVWVKIYQVITLVVGVVVLLVAGFFIWPSLKFTVFIFQTLSPSTYLSILLRDLRSLDHFFFLSKSWLFYNYIFSSGLALFPGRRATPPRRVSTSDRSAREHHGRCRPTALRRSSVCQSTRLQTWRTREGTEAAFEHPELGSVCPMPKSAGRLIGIDPRWNDEPWAQNGRRWTGSWQSWSWIAYPS